jgi:hypothetical protein
MPLCCHSLLAHLLLLLLPALPCPPAAVPQFADSIGLPTSEGLFGFKPFAETWTGEEHV